MTKNNLIELIRRRLGYPMIKIELDPVQISDAIDYARGKWIKWASGNATQETWFTIALSAGQNFYDMPTGVTEIIGYNSTGSSSGGGINTLFTLDNFLYNQGMFEALYRQSGDEYTIVSYHIARDFLETVRRYTPDKYNWKYHRYANQLEIHPAPDAGNTLTVTTTAGTTATIDSPGFILIQSMMINGSSYDGWTSGDSNEDFYGEDWIFDYALAECKIILGRVRTKFSQFTGLGTTGLPMDGESLLQEGIEEKRELKETLQLEESYEGLGIYLG